MNLCLLFSIFVNGATLINKEIASKRGKYFHCLLNPVKNEAVKINCTTALAEKISIHVRSIGIKHLKGSVCLK